MARILNLIVVILEITALFQHLLIPVLSVLSYLFAEDRVPLYWIVLPVAVTLLYGFTMLYLNAKGKVDGPYPFFRIRERSICADIQGRQRAVL